MKKAMRWIQPILFIVIFVIICQTLFSTIQDGIYVDYLKNDSILDLSNDLKVKQDEGITYYTYVFDQEVDGDQSLYLRTYLSNFKVLVDDQIVYSYDSTDASWPRHTHLAKIDVDNSIHQFVLQSKDQNRTNFSIGVYLGKERLIFSKILLNNSFAIVLFIVSLLFSILIVVISMYFRKTIDPKILKGLANLCFVFILTGIWVLSDSEILLLFSSNLKLISYISIFSFMLIPIFSLQFVKCLLQDKHLEFFVFYICFLLHLFLFFVDNAIYGQNLTYLLMGQHLLLVISIIDVLYQTIKEYKKYHKYDAKVFLFGFILLAISVIVALIVFWFGPNVRYSYIYGIGILLFFSILIYSVFHQIYVILNKSFKASIYEELAYLDIMTNLPNRTSFVADFQDEKFNTLILFDINNLKDVNDSFGHLAGDNLIIAAANCIKKFFGNQGRCYRFGGDEFVVMMNSEDPLVIESLITEFKNKVVVFNQEFDACLDIAIGYAIRQANETSKDIFIRADKNMYEKKRNMKQE